VHYSEVFKPNYGNEMEVLRHEYKATESNMFV
jgi:hypothetical protein